MRSANLPGFLLLGLALVASDAGVPSAQPLAETGSIAGVIRTALDDAPIPEAPITATSAANGTTFTARSDPNGRYSLSGLPAVLHPFSARRHRRAH